MDRRAICASLTGPVTALIALAFALAACAGSGASASASPTPPSGPPTAGSSEVPSPTPSGTVRLYTSVTQDTVDAVLAAFATAAPEVTVDVFRAPTGELNARIAAERREGRVRADVIWATDPLSMQQYAADGILRSWTPTGASEVPATMRTEHFVGTRVLDMLIVSGLDVSPAPAAWLDLTSPAYRNAVAIPDPGFAGSAFGALAYFAQTPEFGFDYYRALKDNGAVQVSAIGDVVTGVAEGRFKAGLALDKPIRDAIAAGSPIKLVWPEPGGIAMYSPIGVVEGGENPTAGEAFVALVLSDAGQTAIASTGWRPIRPGIAGPPVDGREVTVDWTAAFDRQAELLETYRSIFGG